MANDREISIGIKASGGDQAAAEAKKAEAAIEQLGKQAVQTDAALDGLAASGGVSAGSTGRGAGKSGKGAAAAMKEIAEEAPKATSAARGFGSVAGQVGFQVQDFAVQVGGGTSALTAFAQQGSQLLGIFGPGGALAGALLAVGAVAYNVFQAATSGGKDSAEAAAELTAEIEKARQAAADAEAERGAQSLATLVETLNAEAEGYRRINEEVAKNISLMQARRRAQAEIESARAALELAEIDADPSLSEEEKIRRRAGVQEGIEQGKLRDRLAGIGDRVSQAQAEVQTRQGAADAAKIASDALKEELAKSRKERDEIAKKASPERKRQLEAEEIELARMIERVRELGAQVERYVTLEKDVPEDLMSEFTSLSGRADKQRKRRDRVKGAVATEAEEARLLALDREIIKKQEDEARELLKAEQDAREALRAAEAKRDQAAAEAMEETTGAVNAFELARQRREVGTGATLRARQEQEAERRRQMEAREAEREARDADRRERENERDAQSIRAGTGSQVARAVGVRGRGVRELEEIERKIEANPRDQATLERYEMLLEKLISHVERLGSIGDARKIRDLEAKVERLVGGNRRGTDGK